MNQINLSGKNWRNPDNFWDDFLKAVGAPEWHGRNLDALGDSVVNGSINKIEGPYCIVISETNDLPKSVVFLLHRIGQLFDELETQGNVIKFSDGVPSGWDYVGRPDAYLNMRVLDLLRDWDPIGVYGPGSTCPDDEYDSYAATVIDLLTKGAEAQEVAQHLANIATSSMGLGGTDLERHRKTAERLVNLWKSG